MKVTKINPESHRQAFAQRNISLADWYVLSIPGQWPTPEQEVPEVAASQSVGDPRGEVSLGDCRASMKRLLDLGWLQVVREPTLAAIQNSDSAHIYGKPVYGYPNVDDIDFTESGAEIFRGLSDELYGPSYFSEAVVEGEDRTRWFYTTRKEKADAALRDSARRGSYDATKSRMGRWCIYWWKVFQNGWRVEIKPVSQPSVSTKPPSTQIADFVRHLLGTIAGREILTAAVHHWQAGEEWSRAEMAAYLEKPESTVFSWIRLLGRPAAKWGLPIFASSGKKYSLSHEMHDEVVRQLGAHGAEETMAG